jgi:SAM-dependent methyltransferase
MPVPRSDALRAFIAESPIERPLVADFVQRAATAIPAGARVLDAGAGEAPYRELFAHTRYVTSDWSLSPHPGARQADVIAPLSELPLEDSSFDHVVCTQVLEHVADPVAVLSELRRVLAPGGSLWLTVPFVGELHEEPHDYFRYTSHGLRSLCERAGLGAVAVEPLSGYWTTLGQMARNCGLATGVAGRRSGLGRRALALVMLGVSRLLPRLDRLDRRRALPLGYGCRALRPAGDGPGAGAERR